MEPKNYVYLELNNLVEDIKRQNQPKQNLGSGHPVQKDYYIVGSYSPENGFSASARPVQHANEQSARAEAERLVKKDSSKNFVVLKVVGIVSNTGINWK